MPYMRSIIYTIMVSLNSKLSRITYDGYVIRMMRAVPEFEYFHLDALVVSLSSLCVYAEFLKRFAMNLYAFIHGTMNGTLSDLECWLGRDSGSSAEWHRHIVLYVEDISAQ